MSKEDDAKAGPPTERTDSSPKSRHRWFRLVLVFLAHQLVGTLGVAFFAYYLGSAVFELLGLFGRSYSMRPVHWILTETPFFPIQIVVGLYLGWLFSRHFKQRPMLWVWVLPFLVLLYALATFSDGSSSALDQTTGRLSHYFGWGCQPKDRCLDQLLVTMPFYAAVAYSAGARLALISEKPVLDLAQHGHE
jgi:FtsH-binding integral membrane protein